jgi:hypothetical protein
MRKVSFAENFHAVFEPLDDPGLLQGIRGHLGIRCESLETFKIYDGVLFLEDVGKPPFRQAPMKGHLSALKATPSPGAGT